MDGWTDGEINECMYRQMNKWIDEWMMDGWMDRWMDVECLYMRVIQITGIHHQKKALSSKYSQKPTDADLGTCQQGHRDSG